MLRPSTAVRRLLLPATVVTALALVSTSAGAPGERDRPPAPRSERAKGFFDARARAAAAPARANAAQSSLRRSLGIQGVVDVDPLTGTPRVVAKLDGFLTEPSSRDAKDIALDYVRANPDVFKLDEDDLAGLVLKRDYTDVSGVRHLMWAQTAAGIPAFDNDLRANLTSDGRLINVLGSPLPDLEAPATDPALGATDALGSALENVGRAARRPRVTARGTGAQQATRFAGGDRANLVLLNTGNGVELAWHVTATADGDEVYNSLVDASSGEVLRRANQVEEATGLAWDYFPSPTLPSGGATPRVFDAWLEPGATRLFGPNAHVYRDFDDTFNSNTPGTGEDVGPSVGNWNYNFTEVTPAAGRCDGNPGWTSACSWDGDTDLSWATNSLQNATQVFYFVNNFHDYLKSDPGIGFGATSSEGFEGNDRVIAHADDGASTGGFQSGDPNMPDFDHLNNANMSTPPNGQSPTMQMYLFTWGIYIDPAVDPTADANGGDDASVVYHEYTHGLSNRLVTYSNGSGALDAHQSGSMGEAWSDWYAMDYLVDEGFAPDTATSGEVILGAYLGNGSSIFRSKALDCPAPPDPCDGYTYGDLGTIGAGPEVHDDGEIWAQTLWDLRQHADVGVAEARALVTEGMRLSGPNPSFLDMRNFILQADTALGLGDQDHIWEVFANRGMGYFASTDHASDVTPTQNFSLPPDPSLGSGTVEGVVTEANTGAPVAGVRVEIPNSSDNLFAVTNSLGVYSIANVPVGTYPIVRAKKSLYDPGEASNVDVQDQTPTPQDLQVRRDWAAYSGGARISKFTGPNYSPYGCGPNGAIDQSHLTGWGSDDLGTRSITVKLPSFVDVTGFAADPGATCGDPDSASLAGYRIEVSKNGTTFTQVRSGTFNSSNNHRLNFFSANGTRAGVRYVRLTMLSNQGHPDFRDLSELSVYGKFRPACLGLAATRIGTEGSNTINGTGGADVIVANGGHDKIYGKGGRDVICGGAGNDRIAAGPGLDRIDAGSGNDRVHTRDGVRERTIRGGSGFDRIRKDRRDRATSFERRY